MRICVLAALTLAVGCGRDPYVARLAGDWIGTADGDAGTRDATAHFDYDELAERPLSGTLELGDGWVYVVAEARSDNRAATVQLVLETGARACTIDATVDGDTIEATYAIDLCHAAAEGHDLTNCAEAGILTLTK